MASVPCSTSRFVSHTSREHGDASWRQVQQSTWDRIMPGMVVLPPSFLSRSNTLEAGKVVLVIRKWAADRLPVAHCYTPQSGRFDWAGFGMSHAATAGNVCMFHEHTNAVPTGGLSRA